MFSILVLNSDDLNTSGSSNNPNSKLGMHIKSEDPATDPLAGVDGSNPNFGGPNNPSGPNRPNMSQNSPDRIQPLPSNVVNKQSNSMDVSLKTTFTCLSRFSPAISFQYMQQQSQIFVFSTQLANKSAEAVRSGQFPTIIAYHCAQPETKKFLQVNRLEFRFEESRSHASLVLEVSAESQPVQSWWVVSEHGPQYEQQQKASHDADEPAELQLHEKQSHERPARPHEHTDDAGRLPTKL